MDGVSPRNTGAKRGRVGVFVAGLACLFLLYGCANLGEKQAESVESGPGPEETVTTPPEVSSVPSEEETANGGMREMNEVMPRPETPAMTPPKAETESEPAAKVTQQPSPLVEESPSSPVMQPSPPVEKSEPVPVTRPSAAANDGPDTTEKKVAPPLNLELLKDRLKETPAIGLFTKLALKNQVDDLLEQFQAYYQGRSSRTLSQLREPYELLIVKVLVLLQDSDPQLGRDLLDSREAIWQVLSDREKFEAL